MKSALRPPQDFTTQSALSDPLHHAAQLDDLPRDIGALCAAVQGLLLHDYAGGILYGIPPETFHRASRETLPVVQRLSAILAADAAPLTEARAPFERSIGTCRDFALLLCAMLRRQGVPARVRCGFARYLSPPGLEDHWVCEYWDAAARRWALADAQLDAAHRDALGIDFEIGNLSPESFVFPWQAWRACREGSSAPARFGHGETTGLWFIQVNLVRDLLSLCNQETSAWDGWRNAKSRSVDHDATRRCDEMAKLGAAFAKGLTAPAVDIPTTSPPWHA